MCAYEIEDVCVCVGGCVGVCVCVYVCVYVLLSGCFALGRGMSEREKEKER